MPQYGRRNRSLLAGVVAGIAHYGNAFGVATVGGEVAFDDAYAFNPLVNAFALGLVRRDQIFFGKASGIGNPVFYVGAKTVATAFTARRWLQRSLMTRHWRNVPQSRLAIRFSKNSCSKPVWKRCAVARSPASRTWVRRLTRLLAKWRRVRDRIEFDLSLVPQREEGMTAYEMLSLRLPAAAGPVGRT